MKLFTIRSLLSLILLLIAASALVAGVKAGVKDVEHAAFLPVALFGITVGSLAGRGRSSMRRAWTFILFTGLLVIFIEAARLPGPIFDIVRAIPHIQIDLWRSIFAKQLPDITLLLSLLAAVTERSASFLTALFSANPMILREVLWDLPILVVPAWAGWYLARHKQVLPALGPSVALLGWVLHYTGSEALALQIMAFCLVLLMAIHQKWNADPSRPERPVRETYTTVVVLSFALAIGAGIMPSVSVREVTRTLTDRDELSETLGLKRDIVQEYTETASGLPLEHLVGEDPATLQTIIFTVDTGERLLLFDQEGADVQEIPRHYWRWAVYDVYSGREWTSSFAEGLSYDANELLIPLEGQGYQIVHQAVEKASLLDDRLYWTGSLARVNRAFEASWRTQPSTFQDALLASDMLGALTNNQTYSADSLIPVISEEQLRNSSTTYPAEIRQGYLPLPSTVSERVLELANELTADLDNPYDRARAIEAHLRTYPYELEVPAPPEGSEVADYFLFDLRTGYCDYYATTMIVLARAAGLPARFVIGYSTGEYDRTSGEYVVRELHGHSWVEIYFSGIGWVEFEPTANRPVILLPGELPDEGTVIAPVMRPQREAFIKGGGFLERNHTPAFIALGVVLSFLSIWFLRSEGLLRSHESIGSVYGYIYHHGKKIHRGAPLHETPSIFAQKLNQRLQSGYPFLRPAPAELEYLTRLYMRETYSAHPVSEDERRQALKIWRRLFWRLLYARAVKI
jgi:transglutaminase-like putative cysteine protease